MPAHLSPSERLVLAHLETHPGATADDIARYLEITTKYAARLVRVLILAHHAEEIDGQITLVSSR